MLSYIALWWQAKAAILFWARCIKCALANTQIESRHCVKCCGFRRITRCVGFESNIITIKLLSLLVSEITQINNFSDKSNNSKAQHSSTFYLPFFKNNNQIHYKNNFNAFVCRESYEAASGILFEFIVFSNISLDISMSSFQVAHVEFDFHSVYSLFNVVHFSFIKFKFRNHFFGIFNQFESKLFLRTIFILKREKISLFVMQYAFIHLNGIELIKMHKFAKLPAIVVVREFRINPPQTLIRQKIYFEPLFRNLALAGCLKWIWFNKQKPLKKFSMWSKFFVMKSLNWLKPIRITQSVLMIRLSVAGF